MVWAVWGEELSMTVKVACIQTVLQFSTQILQLLDQLSSERLYGVSITSQHEYVRSYCPCGANPSVHKLVKDYGALLQNRDMPDQYAFMPLHQLDDTWISPPFDGWHATSFARQSLLKNTTSAGKA
ncbi:UNVERIFIED_CONTAM: hypothetical protein Sindi_1662800 [Sesamum indicum]